MRVSPWQHGEKLMTGTTLTSTCNWRHRVAQHLYLQWPSQVLFMHSSRWRLLKPVKCLLSSNRAGEACLWPRGWLIMPLSGPCPERVQLIPLLWKSYPRETGNKCWHLTGHRPIGKWRQIGREELDLESGLRCSGHLPPWVLSIS